MSEKPLGGPRPDPSTPVAAPPKIRHRTRASLQPAIATPRKEVVKSEPPPSSAGASGGEPARIAEKDRQSRAAKGPVPGLAADDDPDKRDYTIGYGKPPKSGQFKPGKSGNPKGRPKGAKNFTTVLERELNKPVYIVEDGRRRRASRREVIVLQLIKKAAAGDLRAFMALMKLDSQLSNSNARDDAALAADTEHEQSDQDIINAALADLLRNAGAASGTTQSSTSRDKEED